LFQWIPSGVLSFGIAIFNHAIAASEVGKRKCIYHQGSARKHERSKVCKTKRSVKVWHEVDVEIAHC